MAVIMETFSIREYASRMRNIDVVKCWPFGEASEENVKAILPPITVKKFSWWLDEVDKISLIKRNNTIPEESDHYSESLASIKRRRLQKTKGKTPKKRSIVELFAVAPEVERPVSSDEDSIEESGFGKLKSLSTKNLGLDCKIKQKFQKKEIRSMLKQSNQKVFKKNKRRITMKEKICKNKLAPSLNYTQNPDYFDNISTHSKKTKVKSSPIDAKSTARRASKSISKNRRKDFLGRGILKRLTKTHTSENKVCLHKIQKLNKNYALSLKDDSDLSVADLLDKHSAIQKSVSIQETEETEEQTFKWRGNHIDFQPPFENHLRSSNNLFKKSVPSDQCSQYPCCNGTSLLHLSEDLDSRVASVRSMDHFKVAHPQSFHSCSSTLNVSGVNNKELSLQHPWLPPMSPKESLDTIRCNQRSIMQIYGERSLTDDLYGLPLNSQGELIRLSSIDNGGLYQLGGGSSVVTSTNICSNIHSESLLGKPYCVNMNRVTSLPNQQEQCSIKGSRNELEQCQYRRINALTAEMDPSFQFESKLDQLKKHRFGTRQDDQYTNYRRSEIIQHSMQLSPSTMRLMGQEFRIDGRGFRRPENREYFKDKEIMIEQKVDTPAYGSSFKSPFLLESIGGVPECIRMHSSDYNICRASGNLSHVMAQESVTFPHDRMGYRFSKGNSTHDTYPYVSVSSDFVTHGQSHRSLCGSQSLMFHEMCKNTSKRWIQPDNREMPVCAGKLPFEFPFPYSENYRERSLEINPPRCFEPRKKGVVVDYNQTFGGPDSVHHPWTAPPMAYQTSEPSKLFPHYGSQNTIASASLIHQDPALHNPHGLKMKYQIQYNSRIGSQMFNDGNTTKKRMASASNQYHNKPIKVPRSGSLEDSRSASPVENARSNFMWDIGYHGFGPDSGSDKYKPCTIRYGENMINKNETRVSRGKDSSYKTHHGPVKLTAGTKHILKPCQRKKSAILTTPFAANQHAGGALACMKP